MELVGNGGKSQAHHLLCIPFPRGSDVIIRLVSKELYVLMAWKYYPRGVACVVVGKAMAVRSS